MGKPSATPVSAEDDNFGDSGGHWSQEDHNTAAPKKRSRRRHRERSVSPTARGSSSLSASPEEKPRRPTSRQKKKPTHGKSQKKKKQSSKKRGDDGNSSKDTDDSSPECDMLKKPSETEGKKLKEVFERFFGQLCCAIVDPVATAAQLQRKGLLSKSMMKEMITSPESKQEKTIHLVDEVDKRIDLHPDSLFVFVQVLLENDALKEAGTEMLRETGNMLLVHTRETGCELYYFPCR